jgi:hypothetical protein
VDKEFVRSGKYPERNSSPQGGWDFAVARRKLVLLPYFSCSRGSFGIKLNVSVTSGNATNEVSEPKPPPYTGS